MTYYTIRRKDTGDEWRKGSPWKDYDGGHWEMAGNGSRYDAMSLAVMDTFRFDRMPFEVEVVPVEGR